MTWDSVPWFVGGGAEHSPEVARLLAYAATNGAEGIVAPGDLKVAPLAVPGASVRVLTGAALILNKAAGGTQQTYVARNPSEDTVGVSATGSGAGRSDLVVAQIKDPYMPGEPWADPANPKVGPYIFTTIIPNVAPGTTTVPAGVSGIPLARIDIPANTATITSTMIKDLRKLAQARSDRDLYQFTGPATDINTPAVSASFLDWNIPGSPTVTVPTWANKAIVLVTLSGIIAWNLYHDMQIRVVMGTKTGAATVVDLDNTGIAGTATTRETFVLGLTADVTDLQGKPAAFKIQVQNARGKLTARRGLMVAYDVSFAETAI
jgi:hypothetical protein